MRHAILGPGGVGGLIGACLAQSGDSVTLVVRPESLAVYPEQLAARKPVWQFQCAGCARVGSSTRRCSLDHREGHATGAGADGAASPRISQQRIVPLLNGIDHLALLRSRYGAAHVIAATIAVETERLAPGHIVHRSPFARLNVSSAGHALLGGTIEHLQQLGFECQFIDHEPTLMWSKLVFLAAFALTTTASDKTTGEILADPGWRQLGLSCIREAAAVAVAEGAKIDADAVIASVMKMPGNMRSSMQKDVEHSKIPELDAIAGPILRGAQRHGIDVPATKKLVADVERRAGFAPSLLMAS